MKQQELTFRPDDTIYIRTPLGLITMRRIKGKGEKHAWRRVEFTLPEFCFAFLGEKEGLKENFDLVEMENGRVVPKFKIAQPVTNAEGEMIGLVEPRSIRIPDREEETSNVGG